MEHSSLKNKKMEYCKAQWVLKHLNLLILINTFHKFQQKKTKANPKISWIKNMKNKKASHFDWLFYFYCTLDNLSIFNTSTITVPQLVVK